MGRVYIQEHTTKNPISLIGQEAGICYGADTTTKEKNFQRGLDCLNSEHGRTFEFPDVYVTLDGYSARVIREWYTHIGGAPTRLQASTRYIKYGEFEYITPPTIKNSPNGIEAYQSLMESISQTYRYLEEQQIPKEDIANILPLGMTTKVVCKFNLRFLIDMSHQRMCSRAYWEYRELFKDLSTALSNYSLEWSVITSKFLKPKCEISGFCPEKNSCGRKPKKGE